MAYKNQGRLFSHINIFYFHSNMAEPVVSAQKSVSQVPYVASYVELH